jgi:ABC-type lipoprotein release transport system permease subunit
MAQSAASSFGVKIIGVNPADEIRVTKLSDNIIDGTFLESTSKNQIAIGQKLADRLNLGMRKKVILTYQNTKGDIVYLACRISGIFKTESSFFDETTVFLKQEDLTRSLNQSQIIMNESVNTSEEKQNDVLIHEIAFRVASSKDVDTVKKNLAQLFPQLDVQSWEELAPELAYISSSMILFTYLFVGIILFALLFGITNNMLMSVMERIRELGILTAVGMKKLRIFIMILLETILLSLTGGFAGMLLGAFFIEFYNKKGIDLSAFASSLEAFGSGTMLYPFLPLSMYLVLTAMIILAANIASLFPAWKATHLLPAEAIRTY